LCSLQRQGASRQDLYRSEKGVYRGCVLGLRKRDLLDWARIYRKAMPVCSRKSSRIGQETRALFSTVYWLFGWLGSTVVASLNRNGPRDGRGESSYGSFSHETACFAVGEPRGKAILSTIYWFRDKCYLTLMREDVGPNWTIPHMAPRRRKLSVATGASGRKRGERTIRGRNCCNLTPRCLKLTFSKNVGALRRGPWGVRNLGKPGVVGLRP